MADFQPRDESPLRYNEEPPPGPGRMTLVAVLIVALPVAGYFLWHQIQGRSAAPAATTPPARPATPALKTEAEQAVRYPIEMVEPDKPLPPLPESDGFMRELVSALIGAKRFDLWVQPAQLAQRIVATVDNLPRKVASPRMTPLKPVPGTYTPDRANEQRYGAYVSVFEALNVHALVDRYRKAYPLFQQAYAGLGYPNRNFNDRVVEAIDDMLAAPELTSPPALVQPKVFFQYADSDLEERSAGQKIMMRLGPANEAKVKAKLKEIRAELTGKR